MTRTSQRNPPPQIMWDARYKLLLGSVVARLSAADSDR